MEEDFLNKVKNILNPPDADAEFGKLKYLGWVKDENVISDFLADIYNAAVHSREQNNLDILNDMLETWETKATELWQGPHTRSKIQNEIPWANVTKPINESKIALVTTGGFYTSEQKAFETDGPEKLGDWSYRTIDIDIPTSNLNVSHIHYDTTGPKKDPNCVFPLDIFKELEKDGIIGKIANTNYSFMGYIQKPDLLTETTAREVAQNLKADNVDAVVLTST
ncbi:MAG: glycine/sarcosine/betaine reductase selenoprotein B family protein [Dehalococcoidia bacterium]